MIPPVVRRFGWISLLTDAASEMFYPILPFFLTGTLGAPAAVVGLIEGLADGVAYGLRIVAGQVADRLRHNRLLVVAGYTVSAVSKPLIGLAPHWLVVAGLRVSDRFGKAFRGIPRDIMIAEATPQEQRGRVFGYHRAMDTAGAVVGPLVGFGLLMLLGEDNLRPIFLLTAIPAAGTLLLLRRLPTSERRPVTAAPTRAPLPWDGAFGRLLVVMVVFGLGNSSDAFLLLRAADLGLTRPQVVLAYALFNLTYAVASMPAGIRGDRLGRFRVYRLGLLVFAGVYAGFASTPGTGLLWPLMAVYGTHMALTKGVERALVIDLVPEAARGRALAVTQTVAGVTTLTASLAAGIMYDVVSPAAPFVLGAVAASIAWLIAPTHAPRDARR